ncbi:hypothetical protein SARC_10087 [Sphaeroforma arctica JP610]|uniref:PH domain-containing protein n=1 Tax=Sphaeroforma arctica JP610 TaxID=667725 RepID=A0A0L0FN47_9EUKA|nr:hypothetical protein SARC_10087 [Sphaeroforma arctica JP610]KNC77453.1 hypothetical protein SARC_10087 [Sphaeroforma arctica JP610]|eukprot:XP_014151355.1 hypothetical protein SARC_10087 [Sphaeroforma arctica JP610]
MLASSEAQQQQSQTEGGDETLSTKAMEEIHDHYRSRIVTLESELEHAENANITERSRSDQLALECDDLSEEVGKFTMKLNTLTNRITEKNEEIHTIEKLYEESESTNQALKLDNEKLASEMVILRVHLEDAREQVELAKTQIKAQPVLKQPEPSEVSQAANSTEDSGMLAGSNTTDDKNTIESAESQTQAKGVSQIHVIDECNEAVRIASVTAVAQLLAMEEEYKGKLLAMESRFEKEKDALRRREVDLKQAVSTSQRETEKHQEYILKLKKEILDRTRLLEEHYRNKLDSDRRLKQANKSMQILLKSRDKGSMMKLQLQSLYTAFTKHERAATIIFKNLSATSVEQKKGLIQSGLIKRHVKGIAIPTYAVLIQNWLFLYRPEKKENPSTCLHIDTWHVSRMTVPGQHILTLQESDCTAVVQTLELVNQKTQEDWYVGILRASKWWATDDDNVAAILEKEKKKTAQSMQKMKVISLAEAQQTSRHVQSIAASAGAK